MSTPEFTPLTPNSNWVLPCVLAVGGAPLNKEVVDDLISNGIGVFAPLITETEFRKTYDYRGYIEEQGLILHHLPIMDMRTESDENVIILLSELKQHLANSFYNEEGIYVHCWGGHSRSVMITTLLIEWFLREIDADVSAPSILCIPRFPSIDDILGMTRREKLSRTIKPKRPTLDSSEQRSQIDRLAITVEKPTIFFYNEKHLTDRNAGPYNTDPYIAKLGYGEFSNFYQSTRARPMQLILPFDSDDMESGIVTPKSTEHWFQAQKFLGPNSTKRSRRYAGIILAARTPNMAAALGRQTSRGQFSHNWKLTDEGGKFPRYSEKGGFVKAIKTYKNLKIRDDWDEVKDNKMMYVLMAKFSDMNPELCDLLLSTMGYDLQEYTTRDSYWGRFAQNGENMLGRLLMIARDVIHQAKK